jgi:hypothetical protein
VTEKKRVLARVLAAALPNGFENVGPD